MERAGAEAACIIMGIGHLMLVAMELAALFTSSGTKFPKKFLQFFYKSLLNIQVQYLKLLVTEVYVRFIDLEQN